MLSTLYRTLLGFTLISLLTASAAEAPHFVQQDGRHALLVDGKPFLILGGQIHNSSAWPSELPHVWNSMESLHANTIAAPIYWSSSNPNPANSISAISMPSSLAPALTTSTSFSCGLAPGNGNMHYAPVWVKADTTKYPRIIRPDGDPIDVLSPLSHNTLEADKAAFTALTHHLNEIDHDEHTVIMIQVENESGNIGSRARISLLPRRTANSPARFRPTCSKPRISVPALGGRFSAAKPMRSFRPISRRNSSTPSPRPANANAIFRSTSTSGSLILPLNSRSANSINLASATPAAVPSKNLSTCGASWLPRSTPSAPISIPTTQPSTTTS